MKKAKTKKNILTIFSAIFGVVFAFITGVTYCASSLHLNYGTSPMQTSAYMGNQQYYVINDTTKSPVVFGQGAHNFEIAVQYSFAYDFDLRVRYSMSWSNSATTENVILNFADRDNIIYDEEYIFVTRTIPAGSGKVTLITGCEFVDVEDVATYRGARLIIDIDDSDVAIYKSQEKYSEEKNPLYKTAKLEDSSQSVASTAWLQYKKNETSTGDASAYMMLYNYRRDYSHGIPYPSDKTAYKKPVVNNDETDNALVKNKVYASRWAGGNSYYAGTGIYVIAGSTPLKLEIQIGGIWRTSSQTVLSTENNIQFNYTEDWKFSKYSTNAYTQDTGLWEVRTFNYTIPARTEDKTAYYIDILDSIEVTSARGSSTELSADYRLITNQIIINPSSTNSLSYIYDQANDDLIKYSALKTNETIQVDKDDYTSDLISVVNTTKYAKGLYDSFNNNEPEQKTFDGNITLINNTAVTQSVTVSFVLHYHISNAQTTLYRTSDRKRAVDLINREELFSAQDAFGASEESEDEGEVETQSEDIEQTIDTLYYSYRSTSEALTSLNNGKTDTTAITIIIAPYSSVNVISNYSVGVGLSNELLTTFNDLRTPARDEYYDAWTYLVPSLGVPVEHSTDSSSDTTSVKTTLMLETTQTDVQTIIRLKNNTNQAVTGIEISNLSVMEYKKTEGKVEPNEPLDWDASFWKYRDISGNAPANKEAFIPSTYKLVTESYIGTSETIYFPYDFEPEGNKIVDKKTVKSVLLPGESIDIATIATRESLAVSATVTATNVSTPNEIKIINDGTDNAHLINYTNNSYYIRFSVVVTGVHVETYNNKSYYIGVLRPGQILNISMSSNATVEAIDLQGRNYSSEIIKDWDSAAINRFTDYFTQKT